MNEEGRVGVWWDRYGPERVRRGIELDFTDPVASACHIPGEVKWQVSAHGGKNALQKGKYTEGRAAQEKSEGTVIHLMLQPLLKGFFSLIPHTTEGSY